AEHLVSVCENKKFAKLPSVSPACIRGYLQERRYRWKTLSARRKNRCSSQKNCHIRRTRIRLQKIGFLLVRDHRPLPCWQRGSAFRRLSDAKPVGSKRIAASTSNRRHRQDH